MVEKLKKVVIFMTTASWQASICNYSGVDSGSAGGARATPEFRGSEKEQSLIFAFPSLAITASTSVFEKPSTALNYIPELYFCTRTSCPGNLESFHGFLFNPVTKVLEICTKSSCRL